MSAAEDRDKQDKDKKEEKDPAVRVVDRRWWARGETAAGDESVLRKPTYIEDLEKRLADSTAQLQQVMAEHRRSLEEFEQIKSRLRRDTAREIERARRAVLADILDVLDNLDRALKASRDPASAAAPDGREQVARGIELVQQQFLNKLEVFRVARVPAAGQPFDVLKHEAIGTAPVDDADLDGMVVDVVKEGYAIGDDVLRPASVIVGRSAKDD